MSHSRTPIHALVLDYGEVLCAAADPAGMRQMAHDAGIAPARFQALYWELREAYDRGTYDGPSYWRLLAGEAGVPVTEALIASLIAQDVEMWTQIDPQMMAWVDGLIARGVRVGLLSNMVKEIGAHLRDTMGLFRHFTHVTYSCELHVVKPEPAIYQHVLQGLGAQPHEALFVDDRQPNVEAARALGIHAHLFRGREELMEELERIYEVRGST